MVLLGIDGRRNDGAILSKDKVARSAGTEPLDSVVGTYCGVLQTDVETILTLNINGTYLLIQTYKEEQNEQEKLRGTFQVLDGNILMFIHPSSGDNIFYKVRDDNNIILIDSFGYEPKKEDRKNYILKKR